jgi:hypothetical protein
LRVTSRGLGDVYKRQDLVKPRKPNGDLPDVPFLHLAPGSDAIDRGVDVGRPFKGQAPDLGAFESGN